MAAVCAATLLVWLVDGPPGSPGRGTALNGGMQSAGDIGYEHAQIGDEYWAALPLTWNVSDEDLRITRAEFGHVKVKAKSGADHYYIARIKVTGPVDEALKDCRYWYDQDGEHYRQQLDCSTIIRLGPPIVYDDV